MRKNIDHRTMDHPQNGISLVQNRWNFSSFSSFENFTRIIQTHINLLSNWVYSLFQRPVLKKRLEKLEKLEEHEKLENRPTLNATGKIIIIPNTVLTNTYRPYRNKSMHRVGQSPSIDSEYTSSIRLMSYIQTYCQNGRLRDSHSNDSKSMDCKKVKNTKFLHFSLFCNFTNTSINPVPY